VAAGSQQPSALPRQTTRRVRESVAFGVGEAENGLISDPIGSGRSGSSQRAWSTRPVVASITDSEGSSGWPASMARPSARSA
jgi:hypothetical protein